MSTSKRSRSCPPASFPMEPRMNNTAQVAFPMPQHHPPPSRKPSEGYSDTSETTLLRGSDDAEMGGHLPKRTIKYFEVVTKQYEVILLLGTVIMALLFSGISLMRDALSDNHPYGAVLDGPNSIFSVIYCLGFLSLGCVTISCAVAFGGALVTSYVLREGRPGLIIPNHSARLSICVMGLILGPSLLVVDLGLVFVPYLQFWQVLIICMLFGVGHFIEMSDLYVTFMHAKKVQRLEGEGNDGNWDQPIDMEDGTCRSSIRKNAALPFPLSGHLLGWYSTIKDAYP